MLAVADNVKCLQTSSFPFLLQILPISNLHNAVMDADQSGLPWLSHLLVSDWFRSGHVTQIWLRFAIKKPRN